MGKIPSATTINISAYLTELGREYLFDKNNTRFESGNDLFQISQFTLADPDENYNSSTHLSTGNIPDVSGEFENCLKTSQNFVQKNVIAFDIDGNSSSIGTGALLTSAPKYVSPNGLIQSDNSYEHTLSNQVNNGTQIPLSGPNTVTFASSNPDPTTVPLSRKADLETLDTLSPGTTIDESEYNVSIITAGLNQVIDGNGHIHIPIEQSNVGVGSHWITIIPPKPQQDYAIVLFSQKTTNGYAWFFDELTNTYIFNLKLWVNNFIPIPNVNVNISRLVKFNFYGTSTNVATESGTFYFKFNLALIATGGPPPPPPGGGSTTGGANTSSSTTASSGF